MVLPQRSAPLPRGGNAVLVEVVDGFCAVRTSGQGTVRLPPSRVRQARDVVGGAGGVGGDGEGGSQSLEGMLEELAIAKNKIAELQARNAKLVLDATTDLEVSRSQALAQDVRRNFEYFFACEEPYRYKGTTIPTFNTTLDSPRLLHRILVERYLDAEAEHDGNRVGVGALRGYSADPGELDLMGPGACPGIPRHPNH